MLTDRQQPRQPSFERTEIEGDILYSIFSERDKKIVHLSPEQFLDLLTWGTHNGDLSVKMLRKETINALRSV